MKEKTGRFISQEDTQLFYIDTVKQEIFGAVRFSVKLLVKWFTVREGELEVCYKLQRAIQEQLTKKGNVALTVLGSVGKIELSRMYAQQYSCLATVITYF